MAAPSYTPLVPNAVENVNTLNTILATLAASCTTIDTAQLNTSAVTTAKIADANVTDAKLASSNNGAYKTLAAGPLVIQPSGGTGTYWVTSKDGVFVQSGTGGTTVAMARIFAADGSVSGLSTKLRLSVSLLANATPLGTSVVKIGLYPLSAVTGGAGIVTPTLGSVVSGSEVTLNSGWASGVANANGSDFTFPSDSGYIIGATVSTAPIPANTYFAGGWLIQQRNV